jgi:branched-chain amino acid transport system permease protein
VQDAKPQTKGVTAPPRWLTIGALVVGAVVCLALPFVASAYLVTLAFLLLMWVAMASSWNLLSGYTGYVSFGHAGFFGVGAYAGAVLITRLGWHWGVACLAAGLVCVALALVLGWPALRLRGPYFAIALLGLSEVGRIVAVVWEPLTRGGLGISLPPNAELLPDYYAMLALAVAATASASIA